MKKRIFYTEIAYLFGILFIALGTAFMERADFGLSMVVAPAYILHLKISQFLPLFSFGMASYTLQALVLILMMILLRKFKISYFASFVTAVILGFVLDGAVALVGLIPFEGTVWRFVYYIIGMPLVSCGVAFMFRTYFAPEAYDLFVKEVSAHFGVSLGKFKTVFDCVCCFVGVALSFALFGLWHFEGVKLGTVFCALVNGSLIAFFGKMLEKIWTFEDRFGFRKYF